ncbi:MAG: CopG-like 1 or ribbon-helix-helix domain, 5 [Cyanobacteriota bacterium]|jgi:hypothetical protein
MTHAPSNDVPTASSVRRYGTKRICTTLQHRTYKALATRSNQEGRSISNLAAYLLDLSLLDQQVSDA